MLEIVTDNSNLTKKEYSILDILQITKFFGAFFWTNLADRTKSYKFIISIGIVGYAVFFSAFKFAPECIKANGLNKYTFLYKGTSIFFLSSVFATLDTFVLEYLEQKGKERKLYGRIKMFSCIGHGFAHIALQIYEKIMPGNSDKGMSSIVLTLAVAFIAALFISIAFSFVDVKFEKNNFKTKENIGKKLQKNCKYIKELMGVSIFILVFSILLQGIHRQSVTTYLPTYYKDNNIQKNEIRTVFAARTLPELVMLFLTPFIDKAIGIHWMMFVALFFGIFRPLSYAYIHLDQYGKVKQKFWLYGLELSKGIFSALFGYSASKLVKELSTPKTKSLAQGLYNGCYSGLAPCLSGILGYYLLETNIFLCQDNDIRGLFLLTSLLGAIGFAFMIILILRNVTKKNKAMMDESIEVQKTMSF